MDNDKKSLFPGGGKGLWEKTGSALSLPDAKTEEKDDNSWFKNTGQYQVALDRHIRKQAAEAEVSSLSILL